MHPFLGVVGVGQAIYYWNCSTDPRQTSAWPSSSIYVWFPRLDAIWRHFFAGRQCPSIIDVWLLGWVVTCRDHAAPSKINAPTTLYPLLRGSEETRVYQWTVKWSWCVLWFLGFPDAPQHSELFFREWRWQRIGQWTLKALKILKIMLFACFSSQWPVATRRQAGEYDQPRRRQTSTTGSTNEC